MTEGIVLGISGWFTPHGTRYHEDHRAASEIASADWSAFLAHAEFLGFFTRPEPGKAGPDDRIFHLQITSGDRTRALAINDPFDNSELAKLISLARRCLRDRQVLTLETMTDEQIAAIAASMPSEASIRANRWMDE